VRPETMKIQEESTGSTYSDIGHNVFLDMSPEPRETKAKINYWDYIKIKSFSTAKETTNEIKRHPTEWEKIFVNEIPYKVLISKICKELIQLNPQKQIIQFKNGQKTWTDIPPKKKYRWPANT